MYVDRQWCDKKAADFKGGDMCRVKTSYKWGVGPNEQGRLEGLVRSGKAMILDEERLIHHHIDIQFAITVALSVGDQSFDLNAILHDLIAQHMGLNQMDGLLYHTAFG
jgi:hypothetical protein